MPLNFSEEQTTLAKDTYIQYSTLFCGVESHQSMLRVGRRKRSVAGRGSDASALCGRGETQDRGECVSVAYTKVPLMHFQIDK